MTAAIRITIAVLFALSLGTLGYALGSVTVPPSPRLGVRGMHRKQAVEAGGLFATFEPFLRFLAGVIGPLRLDYGIPINHDKYSGSSGRFQFGVGYTREF